MKYYIEKMHNKLVPKSRTKSFGPGRSQNHRFGYNRLPNWGRVGIRQNRDGGRGGVDRVLGKRVAGRGQDFLIFEMQCEKFWHIQGFAMAVPFVKRKFPAS